MAKANNKINNYSSKNNIKPNTKNNTKDNIKDNIKNDEDDDSSLISSYDSKKDNRYKDEFDELATLDDDNISQKAKEHYFKTELLEKIVKYIKIDNKIKELQKEVRDQVKSMKTQREEMETYILGYLDTIKEDVVNITGEGKLTKKVSTTKGAIKVDNIKTSITDELTRSNLIEREKITSVLDSIMDTIEKNRPVKSRTYIKRTQERTKKSKKSAGDKNQEDNQEDNQENLDEDSIPKYSSKNKK